MKAIALWFLLGMVVSPLAAQLLPEDDGPYAAGYRDISVAGIAGGNATVALRVVYPATANGLDAPVDLSGAPYPLVVFGHGFSLSATLYQSLFRHLATAGYVSALVRTEEGLFSGQLPLFIEDLRATVLGVRGLAQAPGPLAGLVSPTARAAAVGHSFGGAAALVAASGHEPLFAAVVTMAATATSPQGVNILSATAALTQPALHFGASGDVIVPVASDLDPIFAATPSTRRKIVIAGGTHSYFHEEWWLDRLTEPAGTIPVSEQQRLVRRYQRAFLDGFLREDPRYLDFLLGPTALADAGLAAQETDLAHPLLFGSGPVAPGLPLNLHPAGDPGDSALIGASTLVTSMPTPYGTLLIDTQALALLPPLGVGPHAFATLTIPVPASPLFNGFVVHCQALVQQGSNLELSNRWTVVLP